MASRKKPEDKSRELRAPQDFDRLLRPARRYRLRLYVAGTNQNSFHAIQTLRQLCDDVLSGRVDLEVIDLYQQPELAKRDDIIAVPALIKISPLPRRMFIGDLSDRRRLLLGLGIHKQNSES
jgi:circadian clock protein KaiB